MDKPADLDDAAEVRKGMLYVVAKTLALDPAAVPASAQSIVQEAQRLHKVESTQASRTSLSSAKGKGKEVVVEEDRTAGLPPIALTDPDDFVLYSQDEAAHIAYAIEVAFGVELDKEVVLAAANVAKLASRVVEARSVLRPGEGGTGMKADLKEG